MCFTILSDGSLIINSKNLYNRLALYKFLSNDVNSNALWSGNNLDFDPEIFAFVNRFNSFKTVLKN